jgi:hypothetical protein
MIRFVNNDSMLVSICSAALIAVSLLISAGEAKAGPDVDGAVKALIDTPINTTGDLIGSAGLITAGVAGGVGDLVAFIDDNEYTRVVLRGIVSKSIHRLALGMSNMGTGGLEGLRAEDLQAYPEAAAVYMEPQGPAVRVDDVLDGIGGTYVALTDALGNPLLMVLRGGGATDQAASVDKWQAAVRDRYFGPVTAK